MNATIAGLLLGVVPLWAGAEAGEPAGAPPKVLFLTHSAGFVHDVVKRPAPGELAPAEKELFDMAKGRFDVQCTQDCADIDAAHLAGVQCVIFYTTGELPISDAGKQALMDWVRGGGGFVGIHCATDTLYQYEPYVQMIGGTFDGHPWHQEVRARVEDRTFPATKELGESFAITDEIYQFKNFQRFPLHVLLTLDPASVDAGLGKRADGDYALAWCGDWGRGRVFYSALGHRLEVWQDPRFRKFLLAGIDWAIRGPSLSAPAPKGATVLFDGKDPAAFAHAKGEAPKWKIVDGALEVAPGAGDLVSRQRFGDALVHVEFRVPASASDKSGQERGNNGVYLQGRYEVQVLDSFGLEAKPDDCGAIYNKRAPNVNACKPAEEWQSYDIRFSAPKFDAAGKKTANARMSVWQNGIPIHLDVEVDAPTRSALGEAEGPTGPLLLQDHGNLVRYRNVWVLPAAAAQ